MNQQIRELAEQAGYTPLPGFDFANELQEVFLKKFAELIVRECMQQCEQMRDDAAAQKKSEFLTESGKMLYEGVYGGANNCGYAIQQHFGVEQ